MNMIHIKNVLERVTPMGAAAALLLSVSVPALSFGSASAGSLTNRSLQVSSTVANDDLASPDTTTYTGLAPGDPRNGSQVSHTYTFTPATTGLVQGFTLEYCETAFGWLGSGACTADALTGGGAADGFSALAWNGGSVTINSESFAIVATANAMTLTNATGITLTAGTPVTISFPADATRFFVNPKAAYKTAPLSGGSTTNGTYFAHIKTYDTVTNASAGIASSAENPTGQRDYGTVTNSVASAIGLYTRVQETLNFSIEGDAASQYNGTPAGPTDASTNCSPLVGTTNSLRMGDTNSALVPNQQNNVTSYFRLSTNASNGTSVLYSGQALSNTNHTFATSASGLTHTDGAEAFGMALETTDMTTLVPAAGYDDLANNLFAFDPASNTTPVAIATTNSTVNCDTGEVRYLASTAPDTPAGIYQTKINYIAAPRY